jgi:hypothetical protein
MTKRHHKRSPFIPDPDILIEEYNRGDSLRELASRYESSKPTIRSILTENGVQIRPTLNSYKYKKGIQKTGANGNYLKEWIPEDHPMASMRDRKGCVLQHRLNAAISIGRPLKTTETVHHINGNPKDNRPENLQIRQGNHGSGQIMVCDVCGSNSISYQELPSVTVYLCGPMANCSYEEMSDWREELKKEYPEIRWLDPCRRSYRPQQWRQLVDDDIHDIDSSDFVLAYYWKPGTGSAMELAYTHYQAKKPSIVVVDDFKTVSPWVRFHASYLVEDFEQAIKIIKAEWYNDGNKL